MTPDSSAKSLDQVYADLLSRAPEHRMQPRLEAVQGAADLLGNPQDAAPVIHITGSNGKTTTARMIEAVLLAYNLRVGRFTSPHLQQVTERICLDGRPVSAEAFVSYWQQILPVLDLVDQQLLAEDKPAITYFEALTLLAFAIFADQPVDVVILEVGIGGSWDATNIAQGSVSVITPISLDHTDKLGHTVAEIAREKRGIIKPGGFLVSAAQEEQATQVLIAGAQEQQVPYRFAGLDFGVQQRQLAVGGQVLTIQGLAGRYSDLALPLFGSHQAENAALALAAIEAFLGSGKQELKTELIQAGWEKLQSPGRLELLSSQPTLIVDAAHNPHGIAGAATAFKEAFTPSRLALVVGILAEKDALGIFEALRQHYQDPGDYPVELYLTQSGSSRAIAVHNLLDYALAAGFDPEQIQTYQESAQALRAATRAMSQTENGMVLVTGSITLVGEIRQLQEASQE